MQNENILEQSRTKPVDEGMRSHFHRVYGTVAMGLLITAVMAYLTSTTPALLKPLLMMKGNMITMLLLMAPLMILPMAMGAVAQRASAAAVGMVFFAFSAYWGWMLSVYLLAFTGTSIARVFMITAIMFGAMSIWGYTTKKDLSKMGSILSMAVIGLLVAIVVNFFLQSTMMHFIISAIGVVVYTVMIGYDTKMIKQQYNGAYSRENNNKMAIMGAMSLYVNIIMLFQFLMTFLGQRE